MTALATLPVIVPCEHLRKAGGMYRCKIKGECAPALAGTMKQCDRFKAAPTFTTSTPMQRAAASSKPISDCRYFGKKLELPRVKCEQCHGTMLDLFECRGPHGKCTPTKIAVGDIQCCVGCDDKRLPGELEPIQPDEIIKINLKDHYNCSVLEFGGRTLLASRLGFTGAKTALHELGSDYQPIWSKELDVRMPGGMIGAEDPRLFVHQDKLHVAITGYMAATGPCITSQLVARLNDRFAVEEVWEPKYAKRNTWEKNWMPFSHDGEIHFIYSVAPHVVLRASGKNAVEVARTSHDFAWPKVTMRGGAGPVRMGGEYYAWFHSFQTDKRGCAVYGMGLYTFAATPPFQLVRKINRVLFRTDERIDGWNKLVVFPCGALLRDGKWIISYGHQDRECRIAIFDTAEIERRLK